MHSGTQLELQEMHVHLDDLSALPDDDLYDLSGRRSLDPADWRRVDDELRRRRHSRVSGNGLGGVGLAGVGLADVGEPAPKPVPIPALTLGDLERLTSALSAQLESTQRQVRRLRWWVLLTPILWALVAAGGVLAAQGVGAALVGTWLR